MNVNDKRKENTETWINEWRNDVKSEAHLFISHGLVFYDSVI